MHTMGYKAADSQELHDYIRTEIKHKFLAGDYILKKLNEHGQHFTVNIVLEGKRDHANEIFNCHVGCVAWPYGRIKIAAPLIKD